MHLNLTKIPVPASEILADFIYQINMVLPNHIEGFYVTGSIPLNDYYSRKSDIDFIMILKDRPTDEVIKRLEKIHFRIERLYNKPNLSGYYMTLDGITEKENSFPSFFKNKMYNARLFELDYVTMYELQTTSLNVIGVPGSSLPIQTKFEDVAKQLYQNINSYWVRWMENHSGSKLGFFLLSTFPQLIEWGVLGVARQLYTLEFKSITSKLNAGLCYVDKVPREFQEILSIAIETRKTNGHQIRVSFKRAIKAVECMNFIINTFNKYYVEKYDS